MNESPLKILLLSAEVVPFAKTGGLADVAGALPKALKELGHDIRVIMPHYGCIDREKFGLRDFLPNLPVPMNDQVETAPILEGAIGKAVPVYFVHNPKYYDREGIYMYQDDAERFIFFCRAALEMLKEIDWKPDILHCNDWHTAIIPNFLQTIYRDDPFFQQTSTVYTIHNLAYQGVFGKRVLEIAGITQRQFEAPHDIGALALSENQVNMMGRGIYFADIVNTVSETYAREILTPEYGEGFDWLLQKRRDRLYGILNGVDYEVNNPATDSHLFQNYDQYTIERKTVNKIGLQQEVHLAQEAHTPLIGIISRLSDQKGFDLIGQVIEPLIANLNFQLVLLGTGTEEYHRLFMGMREKYPARVAAILTFNNDLAQKIYAGSDLFLMPSRFEPCGLGQLLAMRYGSVPIVRETGGLKDTVTNYEPENQRGNGFSFGNYNSLAMYTAIVRAIETYHYKEQWLGLIRRGMSADYSWHNSALKYVELYRRALAQRREEPVPEEYRTPIPITPGS
ncbi:MAG TPA: glycogen synthase [Bacillota bacterium]|nr:glycogen synthase [Bacillota bacterium]